MKEKLKQYIDLIQHAPLRRACEPILQIEEFTQCPAALHYHHNYAGGLLTHTVEVAETSLHLASKFPRVKQDVLLAAALWHDVAKVWEYRLGRFLSGQELPKRYLLHKKSEDWTEVWFISDYGNKVHHINGSNAEFVACACAERVDRITRDAVSHCILAHHGPVKEWGSPVAPQTLEALILHQSDMLSAGYGATKEVAS